MLSGHDLIHPVDESGPRKNLVWYVVGKIRGIFERNPEIIDNLNGMLKLLDNVRCNNLRLVIFKARGVEMSW